MPLLRVNSDRHHLAEVPLADYLRRAFPSVKGLFVYRHRHTENFVVAAWVDRDRGVAHEIMVLGPLLGGVGREHIEELRRRINRYAVLTKDKLGRMASAGESRFERFEDETNEEWLRMKGATRTQVGVC